MKITEVKTFLVDANVPGSRGWTSRNWLFIKIFTDEGIYGVGEGSGWPRVVETAVQDLTPIIIGEDPFQIEKIWQKMFIAMMGHGMTGIVGGGALTAIDMALWDIKGKALGVPVSQLLGGQMRDSVRLYAHARTAERARSWWTAASPASRRAASKARLPACGASAKRSGRTSTSCSTSTGRPG